MANRPENIIVAGLKRTIEYAVLDDGSMPAKEFIDSLLQTSPHAETDILARFRHIADGGEANATDQMFKRERDPFSAFKCKVAGQFVRRPVFGAGIVGSLLTASPRSNRNQNGQNRSLTAQMK